MTFLTIAEAVEHLVRINIIGQHPVLLTNVIQTCSHVSPIVMLSALCLRVFISATGSGVIIGTYIPRTFSLADEAQLGASDQSNFLHDYVRIQTTLLFKLVPIGLRLAGS